MTDTDQTPYERLVELAQRHYDSITDPADIEPAIILAGFARSLMGSREFLDLASVFAYQAGYEAGKEQEKGNYTQGQQEKRGEEKR